MSLKIQCVASGPLDGYFNAPPLFSCLVGLAKFLYNIISFETPIFVPLLPFIYLFI